ncbi:MAG: S8 family serine peptidase, partial [Sedimentisphaerales bacterium]
RPKNIDPNGIMDKAMNPGLGVHKLHQQGITGKGVNVAIIDQPLYRNHPEFAGKIVEYFDAGCKSEASMHGPAVASLLAGTNCGTAPDANVFYAAAPSWTKDTAYQAKALDWIVEQNAKLPAGQKIRVVSVSAARGRLLKKNGRCGMLPAHAPKPREYSSSIAHNIAGSSVPVGMTLPGRKMLPAARRVSRGDRLSFPPLVFWFLLPRARLPSSSTRTSSAINIAAGEA